MDGQRGRRYEPAVVAWRRNDAFARKQILHSGRLRFRSSQFRHFDSHERPRVVVSPRCYWSRFVMDLGNRQESMHKLARSPSPFIHLERIIRIRFAAKTAPIERQMKASIASFRRNQPPHVRNSPELVPKEGA